MKVAEQKRLEKRREVTRREERLREEKLREGKRREKRRREEKRKEEKRKEEKRREEIRGKEREGDRSRAKQRKDDPSKGEEKRREEKRGEERAVKQMSFPFHFAEGPPNRFFLFSPGLTPSTTINIPVYSCDPFSTLLLYPLFHPLFTSPILLFFQHFLTFLTFSSLLELILKKFYWRDREQRNT